MTDNVNHPPHYTSHPSGVECIEITEWLGFNLGNAFKYLFRRNDKGALKENLEKAMWYLEREKARREKGPLGGGRFAPPERPKETKEILRATCTRVVGHEPTFVGGAMGYILEASFTAGTEDIEDALTNVRGEIARVCK